MMRAPRPSLPSLVAVLAAAAVAVPLAGAPAAGAATKRPRLVAFDSCRALVGHAPRYAARAGGAGVRVRALGATPQALRRPQVMTTTTGEAAPVAAPLSEDQASAGGTNEP